MTTDFGRGGGTGKLPVVKIFNKADILPSDGDGIAVNSTDANSRTEVLNRFKAALLKVVPEDFIHTPPLLGDLAPAGSTVVLIVPIDLEAPKAALFCRRCSHPRRSRPWAGCDGGQRKRIWRCFG